MKTYLSVGIGDMVRLDSLLTMKEKANISEMYWATHAGKYLEPLFTKNPHYPNLHSHHFIEDKVGRENMQVLDSNAVNFWHYRPDFSPNFSIGLFLFNLTDTYEKGQLNVLDCMGIFEDEDRKYTESSFLEHHSNIDEDYILFHYPTSTRPRSDIAIIEESDWGFVEELSIKHNMVVYVVSDHEIAVPLSRYKLLVNKDIVHIKDLCMNAKFYAGGDSFCAHLCTKKLKKENIFIKSHETNIETKLLTTSFYKAFLPHSREDVVSFYKNYIG